MRRKIRLMVSITAAVGIALAAPATALAEGNVGDPGLRTDPLVLQYLQNTHQDGGPIPVQFWAEGNDNCQVDFTIVNRTNSDSYLVDYVVDNENPLEIPDDRQPNRANGDYVWDFKDINKGPYKGTHVGERSLGRVALYPDPSGPPRGSVVDGKTVGLKTLGEPVTATTTVNLRDLPGLPNPEADNHTITYQQIAGPDHGINGVQSDMPVFTTEVTGCANPFGSLGSGSIVGSLGAFSSLHSLAAFGSGHFQYMD